MSANQAGFSSKRKSFYNVTEKTYTLARKAPLPPVDYNNKFKHGSYKIESITISRNSIENENTQSRSATSSLESNQQDYCFGYILEKLIEKEKKYIIELNKLFKNLKFVSTNVSKKVIIMEEILKLHQIFLQEILKITNPLELATLFLKYGKKLNLYGHFAENKNDFSYLVTDISEIIIDQFKSRLLEYNFVLSQIQDDYTMQEEGKGLCEDAETLFKSVYQNIIYVVAISSMKSIE